LRSHSAKDIVVSDQKELRLANHAGQEVIAGTNPPSELLRRLHHGVDLATEPIFSSRQNVCDVPEGDVPDDEEVDVARGTALGIGQRAEDEGRFDPRRQAGEGRAQRLRQARRLDHDGSQLFEHRTAAIRLVVDLPAALRAFEDPCTDERRELPRGDCSTCLALGQTGRWTDATSMPDYLVYT
jgi:hypothetical protein